MQMVIMIAAMNRDHPGDSSSAGLVLWFVNIIGPGSGRRYLQFAFSQCRALFHLDLISTATICESIACLQRSLYRKICFAQARFRNSELGTCDRDAGRAIPVILRLEVVDNWQELIAQYSPLMSSFHAGDTSIQVVVYGISTRMSSTNLKKPRAAHQIMPQDTQVYISSMRDEAETFEYMPYIFGLLKEGILILFQSITLSIRYFTFNNLPVLSDSDVACSIGDHEPQVEPGGQRTNFGMIFQNFSWKIGPTQQLYQNGIYTSRSIYSLIS